MGIQVTITGDNFASIKGDMQDFVDGGYLDISGADFDATEVSPNELPAPAKQRRGRKTKAAAPAAGTSQTGASATLLPASPVASPAPAAAAPLAAAPTQIATGSADAASNAAPAASTLGPDAVAPGGIVFNAVKAFNDKHGMEKARALLLEFGCGMVRQIKPEQYAAVIAKCAA